MKVAAPPLMHERRGLHTLRLMETIVVAYDNSKPARLALKRAAELAQALGSRLVVTTVAPVEHAAEPTLDLEELRAARAVLESEGVEATYQPAIGEPADAIVDVAKQVGADLIVVGTRDPGPVQRLLGYSVSQGVLRRARCNVLVVRR